MRAIAKRVSSVSLWLSRANLDRDAQPDLRVYADKRMPAGERTGWHLRVVRAGTVAVGGPIEVASHDALGISVATAFAAMVDLANG